MNILVVDDDADSAELLALSIERAGWKIVTASTVEEGRRALREGHYQVLISDFCLADGVGLGLLDPAPAYPCVAILVTGAADEGLRRKSAAAGFQHCFGKPVAMPALLDVLQSVTRSCGAGPGRDNQRRE